MKSIVWVVILAALGAGGYWAFQKKGKDKVQSYQLEKVGAKICNETRAAIRLQGESRDAALASGKDRAQRDAKERAQVDILADKTALDVAEDGSRCSLTMVFVNAEGLEQTVLVDKGYSD